MSLNVIFRADASRLSGSGHVMRCLTLAEQLRGRGARVGFVCREHPGHLIDLIEAKGYPVTRLPCPPGGRARAAGEVAHAAWLEASWNQDAADTIAALQGARPSWLIVDHYALDHHWEQELRPCVEQIMVIDDLADRRHDCDLLLDQNLSPALETRYDGLVGARCQKLLGPKYALLRPEFAEARKTLGERSGTLRRVLVFFGGVDQDNETERALLALTGIPERRFEIDVVVGSGNPLKGHIEAVCAKLAGVRFHCQVDNMAQLMAAADLAVGAGGSTTWERCALGLPALVTALAENQRELAQEGARQGLFFYLGEASRVAPDALSSGLRFALASPETLRFYAANCLKAVDGRGADRVASRLLPVPLELRRASLEDCDSVYRWRNAEETRRFIFDGEPIALEAHRDWYRRTLENPARVLLIGESGAKPVGVLRYDFSGEEALISVYLVPGGQGRGVGSQLIRCGSRWIREHQPQIKVIQAQIFPQNAASLRAFESAGYLEHHLIYQEVL